MARETEISVEELAKTLEKELTYYQESVIDKALENETKRAMKKLVETTKSTAPVGNRSKHYRDSISRKVLHKGKRGYGQRYREVWYVKGPDYRLSHLLEKGHANRDGSRTPGTHFIRKASEPILEEYVRKIEEAIGNG